MVIKELHNKLKGAIGIVDFGGQYAHLIASKIRRLGAFSEVFLPEDLIDRLKKVQGFYKGIILSGGPSSVYEKDAPNISKKIFDFKLPILGICYGHQWIMHTLNGKVKSSLNREYGPAIIKFYNYSSLLKDISLKESVVWMSHGDEVVELPDGFELIGSTSNCRYAFVANEEKKIYGVQFHPEVHHTEIGEQLLKNFILMCGLENTWNLQEYYQYLLKSLKEESRDKTIFFLVSGGVDSTVAFTLLGKIKKASQLYGVLIDTGFLRFNEAKKIQKVFSELNIELHIEDRSEIFFQQLENIYHPEEKRKIIGNLFISIQNEVISILNVNSQQWLIGQGTIYPDTIESGSTKFSQTIKTHHNRVDIVQKMIDNGLIIEPLRDLYKDEVRKIGKLLGLSDEIVFKHPFPGPGLAIRCLCNNDKKESGNEFYRLKNDIKIRLSEKKLFSYVLPINSVGVQGDQRTYTKPIALIPFDYNTFMNNFNWTEYLNLATEIVNSTKNINRVILLIPHLKDLKLNQKTKFEIESIPDSYLTKERIELLRYLDNICYEFLKEKKIYYEIWQMPVILLPLKHPKYSKRKESLVLRPVQSVDAMTASVYPMKVNFLLELVQKIYESDLISYVFYDLTTKPPGTIEWE